MGSVNYESVITSIIGEFGVAQLFIVITVKYMALVTGWGMVMASLSMMEPDWWTEITMATGNTTTNSMSTQRHFKVCPETMNSSSWRIVFDDSVHTIVGEWNLVCNQDWIPGVIMTTQMVGVMLGASVVGQISDWYGRRKSVALAYCCILLSALLQGFSSSWYMMCVFAFTLGFGLGGFLVCSNIYYVEYVGTKWRTFIASVIPAWAMGVMLLGGVFKWLPNWRYICYANVIIGVPALGMIWFCPESLRWLLTQNRMDETKHTLDVLAKRNSRPPAEYSALNTLSSLATENAQRNTMVKYNYVTLFANKFARWRTLVFGFIWFSMAFGYYAITFGVGLLDGDVSVNMVLLGVVEIFSQWAVIPVSKFFGRRWSTSLLIFLTSASLFGVTMVYETSDNPQIIGTTKTVLALAAKFFISAAWGNVILFTMETFPTVIRNAAYGVASIFGRVGGILAPQNKVLLNIAAHIPFTLNGGVQLISAILTLLLSDTYSTQLPDHFQGDEGEGAGGEQVQGVEMSDGTMLVQNEGLEV